MVGCSEAFTPLALKSIKVLFKKEILFLEKISKYLVNIVLIK